MKTYIVHPSVKGVRLAPFSIETDNIGDWFTLNLKTGEEVVSIVEVPADLFTRK